MWIVAPLLCGLIFGAGLLISGMVQPTKVLGFLDIFGAWDPSLAVVMAAALAVAVPGFMLADRARAAAGLPEQYFRPGKSGNRSAAGGGRSDVRTRVGSCRVVPRTGAGEPRDAVAGIIVFVVAMAGGMIAHDAWQRSRLTAQRDRMLASATDG